MNLKELIEATPNIMVVVTLGDLKEFANDLKKEEERKVLLDTKITDFNLSVRTLTALKRSDVQTLGDLLKLNKAEIASFRDIGQKALIEIRDLITDLGFKWQ